MDSRRAAWQGGGGRRGIDASQGGPNAHSDHAI